MRMCDALKLPGETFTKINYDSLLRSRLDHCAVSERPLDSLVDCKGIDDFSTSDHCYLHLRFEFTYR